MTEPLVQFLFISIFHAIGGAALGVTLRGWVNNPGESLSRRAFFLIWGGMFGCMPLLFGLESGPLVLGAQLAVLLAAIAIPFIWLDRLREMFSNQHILQISFGGVFFVSGLAAVSFLTRERQWLPALIFGVLFIGAGGLTMLAGMRGIIYGPPDE